MKSINVLKQDYLGRDVWKYSGKLVEKNNNKIVIEAYFDRGDTQVDQLMIRRGDKFIETYYSDQWYNIYEIQDQLSGQVKAWYCNLCYPAQIGHDSVFYRDLELDLLVYPDGAQVILDMEEFEALPIANEVRLNALQGLKKLRELFSSSNFSHKPD
jgi:protein associated with RNAse G/E